MKKAPGTKTREGLPRRRAAVEKLVQDFSELAYVDQLESARLIGEYLELEKPLLDDEAAKRQESVVCIQRAAEHLGLGLDRPLKVEEYKEAAAALELKWSWQQIHRLWGSFALPTSVACGARVPSTAQTRAFLSHYHPRTSTREEGFAAVRRWLATKPLKLTCTTYDEFAREYNYALPEDGSGLPLPRFHTIKTGLALPWRAILAVAGGEVEHPDVVADLAKPPADQSRGPHDLVGVSTIALLAGLSLSGGSQLTHAAGFPREAVVLRDDRRGWLREEVEAYFAGKRFSRQGENRFGHLYLSAYEVADRLGLKKQSLRIVPLEPTGTIGRYRYWLKEEVEAYERENAAAISYRRQRWDRPGTLKRAI